MKLTLALSSSLALSLLACSTEHVELNPGSAPTGAASEPSDMPTSDLDRGAYSLGFSIGKNLVSQQFGVDPQRVLQGFRTGLADTEPLLTEEDMKAALEALQTQVQAAKVQRLEETAARNRENGTGFLATNKKRSEVSTTASGLQYDVLEAGTGPKPAATETVSVHYRGTLIDGTPFDSSYDRGQPASFAVNGVIAGWTEALQLMGVGSRWKLFVPAELAYGDRGAGALIGPGATLIFEVELLSIQQ